MQSMLTCTKNHYLVFSNFPTGYSFMCDRCRVKGIPCSIGRFRCNACDYDLCQKCTVETLSKLKKKPLPPKKSTINYTSYSYHDDYGGGGYGGHSSQTIVKNEQKCVCVCKPTICNPKACPSKCPPCNPEPPKYPELFPFPSFSGVPHLISRGGVDIHDNENNSDDGNPYSDGGGASSGGN